MSEHSDHFFVCTTCLTKHKHEISKNMDNLVSIDDFKTNYVTKMTEEMGTMKDIVNTNLNYIDTHIKLSCSQISQDYKRIEDNLVNHVR